MAKPIKTTRFAVIGVLALGCAVLGCGKGEQEPVEPAAKQTADDKPVQADPDADPGDAEPAANFATPQAEPPPAPEGATTLRDPWLYVQTCAEPHPCPDLLQPEGDKHCRELELGGHVNWRLPSKDEVGRFMGVEALEAREGFHWTRSPDEQNMDMAYIVNPEDTERTRMTTIPRGRKPFRIRCVKQP